MSWLDPNRVHESEEDCALRQELRGLLGLPEEGPLLQAEPTPDTIALAERLREEAARRKHTTRRHRNPTWLMAAAALPFLLATVGLSAWGFQQKHRAESLARDLEQQRQNHQQQLIAVRMELEAQRNNAPSAFQTAQTQAQNPNGAPGVRSPKGLELVIPAQPNRSPILPNTTTVKERKP